MASLTVTLRPNVFPEGTGVSAWLASAVTQGEDFALSRPAAAAAATGTVTNGQVTFNGLTDGALYVVGNTSGSPFVRTFVAPAGASRDGRAVNLKPVVGTNPAANNEVSETVPAGKVWELLAVTVACVESGVATPRPTLVIDDGTNTLVQSVGASNVQTAGTTVVYSWFPGATLTSSAAAAANAPIPSGLKLYGGYRVRTVTAGLAATVDYGAPTLFVVEGT